MTTPNGMTAQAATAQQDSHTEETQDEPCERAFFKIPPELKCLIYEQAFSHPDYPCETTASTVFPAPSIHSSTQAVSFARIQSESGRLGIVSE